ncbi:MAG: glycoside hydrolase family 2 protein, partial [Ignavibacteria bacterium]|nr:glycoside hydrolase family 2 protein [Ignavibacteria bacterium]
IEDAKVKLEFFDMSGKSLFINELKKDIDPNKLTYFFTPQFPTDHPEIYLARLTLNDSSGKIISRNDYWKNTSKKGDFKTFNTLQNVIINGKQIELNKQEHALKFVVENQSNEIAIAVKLNLVDENNQVILPAYFSDGYFNLLPMERREVSVTCDVLLAKELKVRASGYNLTESIILKIKK